MLVNTTDRYDIGSLRNRKKEIAQFISCNLQTYTVFVRGQRTKLVWYSSYVLYCRATDTQHATCSTLYSHDKKQFTVYEVWKCGDSFFLTAGNFYHLLSAYCALASLHTSTLLLPLWCTLQISISSVYWGCSRRLQISNRYFIVQEYTRNCFLDIFHLLSRFLDIFQVSPLLNKQIGF